MPARILRKRKNPTIGYPLILAVVGFFSLSFALAQNRELDSIEAQAQALSTEGQHEKAIALLEQLLQRRIRLSGVNSSWASRSHNELGLTLIQAGQLQQGISQLTRALEIALPQIGEAHESSISLLMSLGSVYIQTGQLVESAEALSRARDASKKCFGPKNPKTLQAMHQLGNAYSQLQDYDNAKELLLATLQLRKEVLGESHLETGITHGMLVEPFIGLSEFETAEEHAKISLAISEKTTGIRSKGTAKAHHRLGKICRAQGKTQEAITHFEKALAITENLSGENSDDLVVCMNGLAKAYADRGLFSKAESLYHLALNAGENNPQVTVFTQAALFNSVAGFYRMLGSYEKAYHYYHRSLDHRRSVTEGADARIAVIYTNLAGVLLDLRRYDEAVELNTEALAINTKLFGPDSAEVANTLNNLGFAWKESGNQSEAFYCYQKSLKTYQKKFGADDIAFAVPLQNLGCLAGDLGRFEEARTALKAAFILLERTYGPDNPQVISTLSNLALAEFDLGNRDEAQRLTDLLEESELGMLRNILSFGTETQRQQFRQNQEYYCLNAALGDASGIASKAIKYKGVVLDSIIEDRKFAEAANNDDARAVLSELNAARHQANRLLLDPHSTATKKQGFEIRSRIEQLERSLAKHASQVPRARQALSIEVDQIQETLSAHSAVVELIHFSSYLGLNEFENHYGAVVINSTGPPLWADLGPATQINALITDLQQKLEGGSKGTIVPTLTNLYELLWSPLESLLSHQITSVVVCPDSYLNFVPFALLSDKQGNFLCDRLLVSYVASSRDLLDGPGIAENKTLALFSNPDFNLTLPFDQSKVTVPDEARSLSSLTLGPLPGTALEGRIIEELFVGAGWSVEHFSKAEATEPELAALQSPRILHIASHGFFLPETSGEDTSQISLKNPMHRSGLALAGGQATLMQWAKGKVPDGNRDGILTAEEVSLLNLDDTELIVLSACETALGEASTGEGVMGLRRGFGRTGAAHVIMTLWPIPDDETVEFMTEFYTEYFQTRSPEKALPTVQRDLLKKWEEQYGIDHAIRAVGAFVINSYGK